MLNNVLFSKTLSQSIAIATGVITGSLLISSAPVMAATFTATFDNLNFSGGEVVDGTITYNDDPTCCTATTGSITATGGIFAGETIVWEASDVLTFDNNDEGASVFGVNKNTTLFNNAAFFFLSNVDQLTTLGDVPLSFSQVNRDGVLPSNFISGTVTISETVTETIPEPTSLVSLLGLGALSLTTLKKKKRIV